MDRRTMKRHAKKINHLLLNLVLFRSKDLMENFRSFSLSIRSINSPNCSFKSFRFSSSSIRVLQNKKCIFIWNLGKTSPRSFFSLLDMSEQNESYNEIEREKFYSNHIQKNKKHDIHRNELCVYVGEGGGGVRVLG